MPAFGSNQDYATRIPVSLNGTWLTEATSVEATLESGRTEIFTTAKGFAGFAEGAMVVSIRVNLAVPVSGLEINVWELARTGDWVTIQIGVGAEDFASTGKITTAGISNSVNQAVESSFEWRGPAAPLE